MHLSDPAPTVIIHNSLSYASQLGIVLNKHLADNPTDPDFVLPVLSLAHRVLSLPRRTLVTEESITATTQVWALAELVRNVTVSLVCIVVAQTSGDIAYMIPRRDIPFQYLMSLLDDEFWDGKLELKLWLLVVQLCTEASLARTWYLGQIIDTTSRLGRCSWKELMSCLRDVVWIEGLAPLEMAKLQWHIERPMM
jgi:hypothetical protein